MEVGEGGYDGSRTQTIDEDDQGDDGEAVMSGDGGYVNDGYEDDEDEDSDKSEGSEDEKIPGLEDYKLFKEGKPSKFLEQLNELYVLDDRGEPFLKGSDSMEEKLREKYEETIVEYERNLPNGKKYYSDKAKDYLSLLKKEGNPVLSYARESFQRNIIALNGIARDFVGDYELSNESSMDKVYLVDKRGETTKVTLISQLVDGVWVDKYEGIEDSNRSIVREILEKNESNDVRGLANRFTFLDVKRRLVKDRDRFRRQGNDFASDILDASADKLEVDRKTSEIEDFNNSINTLYDLKSSFPTSSETGGIPMEAFGEPGGAAQEPQVLQWSEGHGGRGKLIPNILRRASELRGRGGEISTETPEQEPQVLRSSEDHGIEPEILGTRTSQSKGSQTTTSKSFDRSTSTKPQRGSREAVQQFRRLNRLDSRISKLDSHREKLDSNREKLQSERERMLTQNDELESQVSRRDRLESEISELREKRDKLVSERDNKKEELEVKTDEIVTKEKISRLRKFISLARTTGSMFESIGKLAAMGAVAYYLIKLGLLSVAKSTLQLGAATAKILTDIAKSSGKTLRKIFEVTADLLLKVMTLFGWLTKVVSNHLWIILVIIGLYLIDRFRWLFVYRKNEDKRKQR